MENKKNKLIKRQHFLTKNYLKSMKDKAKSIISYIKYI